MADFQREKLIELRKKYGYGTDDYFADGLLSNGVIAPPCNVGDTVYPKSADRNFRAFIDKIEITTDGLLFYWVQYDVGVECTELWDDGCFSAAEIGKTVFLTEVEYEIALKEGAENG